MDIKQFESINLITTEADEDEVKLLFSKEPEEGLICGECGGTRFTAEAFCKAEVDLLSDKGCLVVFNIKEKEVLVNRIMKCTICGSEKDHIQIIKNTEKII
jgi:hypothetical protein